jgi:hypothetical protein
MFTFFVSSLSVDGFNPPTTFASVEDTEIPALQEHCHNSARAARDAYLRRFADKSLFFLNSLNFQLQEFESHQIQKRLFGKEWEAHYSKLDGTLTDLVRRAVHSIEDAVEMLIIRKLRRILFLPFLIVGYALAEIMRLGIDHVAEVCFPVRSEYDGSGITVTDLRNYRGVSACTYNLTSRCVQEDLCQQRNGICSRG